VDLSAGFLLKNPQKSAKKLQKYAYDSETEAIYADIPFLRESDSLVRAIF